LSRLQRRAPATAVLFADVLRSTSQNFPALLRLNILFLHAHRVDNFIDGWQHRIRGGCTTGFL